MLPRQPRCRPPRRGRTTWPLLRSRSGCSRGCARRPRNRRQRRPRDSPCSKRSPIRQLRIPRWCRTEEQLITEEEQLITEEELVAWHEELQAREAALLEAEAEQQVWLEEQLAVIEEEQQWAADQAALAEAQEVVERPGLGATASLDRGGRATAASPLRSRAKGSRVGKAVAATTAAGRDRRRRVYSSAAVCPGRPIWRPEPIRRWPRGAGLIRHPSQGARLRSPRARLRSPRARLRSPRARLRLPRARLRLPRARLRSVPAVRDSGPLPAVLACRL